VVIRRTFEMLNWSNQKDWSREQATPKRELVMLFQVVFLLVLSCKQWSKEEASQPQQKIVHLIISGSQIHVGEDLIYQLVSMIGLHQAYQLDFTLLLEKWIGIYVTILFSNIAKISLKCAWSFHPLLVCS